MAISATASNCQSNMQQITPIEIRQKNFSKSFRGYKPDEVDAFLHSLAYAWEKLNTQLNETVDTLESSNKEVKRLQGVENAILKTVNDSESTARSIIEQATKKAELRVRETELEVEKMLREAREKVKIIEEDGARRHQLAQEKMTQKLEAVRKIVEETETYRDSLLQKLQHLAEDILSKGQMIEKKIHTDLPIDEDPQKDMQKLKENASFPPPNTAMLSDEAISISSDQPITLSTGEAIKEPPLAGPIL